MGATGEAQAAANSIVDSAQKIANDVIDLGEQGVVTVLDAVITANSALGQALETLKDKLVADEQNRSA